MLERNKSIFESIYTAIETFADFVRDKMRNFDYTVNIYPLVSNRKFWNYVETADEIYELDLELSAPNMALFGNKIKGSTQNYKTINK